MSYTEDITNGASILQQVDVTDIITSLALGIAAAQEKLDDNSIKQLTKLSETEVGDKSLLELGFTPAFYSFDYADVSASISLRMALKKSDEFSLKLSADYKSNADFDKDFFKSLEDKKKKKTRKEFKSVKDISLKAKIESNITLNADSYNMHQEDGTISRVEDFGENVRTNNQEYRVSKEIEEAKEVVNQSSSGVIIRKAGPYITLYIPETPTSSYGLLKLDSVYPTTSASGIDINLNTSKSFKKYGTFNTTFNRAKTENTGTVYGLTEDGFTTDGTTFEKPKIYFGWDKDEFDPTYQEGAVSNATPELSLYLDVLGQVLREDTDSKINIIGYTDGSGDADYNKDLSKRRVDAITRHFFGKISNDPTLKDRIKSALYEGEKLANGATARDENLRYVSIEVISDNDYIFFEGGEINAAQATPNVASTDANKFIVLEDTSAVAPPAIIKFTYGGEEVVIKEAAVDESSKLSSKSLIAGFHHEKVGELSYLLHEESMVNYTVYNSESEELDVTVDGVASAELDKEKTKVFVSETETSKTRLNTSSKEVDGNRTFAVSGSIDFRTSRQFDMSVEGNASLAARMKSVPAPQEFLDYITQVLSNSNSAS
ncbi:hypothetical protein ACFO3O_21110 [Dokdonia ponticola]|uniref:OmpA-like domain-containing protein n=1 Tax=Dokdonia ponticola TaxID=2041041 RepID=A0ABV9I2S3_9FLAO